MKFKPNYSFRRKAQLSKVTETKIINIVKINVPGFKANISLERDITPTTS